MRELSTRRPVRPWPGGRSGAAAEATRRLPRRPRRRGEASSAPGRSRGIRRRRALRRRPPPPPAGGIECWDRARRNVPAAMAGTGREARARSLPTSSFVGFRFRKVFLVLFAEEEEVGAASPAEDEASPPHRAGIAESPVTERTSGQTESEGLPADLALIRGWHENEYTVGKPAGGCASIAGPSQRRCSSVG